jgi:hypothetical protein
MAKPAGGPANPLQDVKRALIAFMVDEKETELHISPDAAGRVLLAPDDWDIVVSQDRNGIHVALVDKNDSPAVNLDRYRPPVSPVPDFEPDDASDL